MAKPRGSRYSADHYGTAMEALAKLTSQNSAGQRPNPDIDSRRTEDGHASRHDGPSRLGPPGTVAPRPPANSRAPVVTRPPTNSRTYPHSQRRTTAPRVPATGTRTGLLEGQSRELPLIAEEAAKIVGVWERPEGRDPGVEANARLTATTGLVLSVLFILEGLTLPLIFPLLSWHIMIGLAIVPPLLVKIGSTTWRFARYYLGDQRFRRAGPPHPLLRILGPFLMGSTVVLIGSGIALWLAGPRSDLALLRIHQVSFVLWFGCIAVHFVSHLLRAVRLAAADSRDAQSPRPSLPGAHLRRGLVVASLVVGLGLALVSREVATGWSHVAPAKPIPASAVVRPTTGTASRG